MSTKVKWTPSSGQKEATSIWDNWTLTQDTATSDVELMVVSDALGYADLFSALEPASQRLGRKVNPTLYSRAEFAKRLQQRNAFATRVLGQSKLWVLGNEEAMNDITA